MANSSPDAAFWAGERSRLAQMDQKLRAWRSAAVAGVSATVMLPPIAATTRFLPNSAAAWKMPRMFHRVVCKAIGMRVRTVGQPVKSGAALYIANHISWVDIPVIGGEVLGSFVAKAEIEGWGFFGWLSDLQQTIYVERERRAKSAEQKNEIAQRLHAGTNVILFPEGTSGTGDRVLPFKSSLFAVADGVDDALIQPVTLAYTHINGLPITRTGRFKLAWVGDMDLGPHIWDLIGLGQVQAVLHFHDPVRRADFPSRKELARHCETVIAKGLEDIRRGRL